MREMEVTVGYFDWLREEQIRKWGQSFIGKVSEWNYIDQHEIIRALGTYENDKSKGWYLNKDKGQENQSIQNL